MKKLIAMLLAVGMCFTLGACSTEKQGENPTIAETKSKLSAGDEVSIVGQVASTVRDGDSTLSIQIQNEDDRWVIYHCEMKDEFLEEAKGYKMSDVVKIKGLFLNEMDLEQENTAIMVYLYDCEIVK